MSTAILALAALALAARSAGAAPPVFENGTPVGFSPADSAAREEFVSGNAVSVRVDLDRAATAAYPVIGHFHAVERSEQLSTTDTDGLQVDVAMARVAPFGLAVTPDALQGPPVIHVAWIEQSTSTTGPIYTGGTTPAYEVLYAHSDDGGASFSTPVSVSEGISYYLLTTSGTAFSTLDLEVDSGGKPRVTYAFVSTANRARNRNVYFGHSEDGGENWETPVVVNDLTTAGNSEGRRTAFPRLAIDDRDNVFIAYVRGASRGTGTDDVMLAKVNRTTSPFSMVPVGSLGTTGSSGGVRLTPNAKRHTGPDLAVGDGDALHVLYFSDADDRIEHKRLATDTTWVDVSPAGWDQDADGATVGSFVDESAGNAALEEDATFYFPAVAIDRNRLPDRVYSVYKYGDGTPLEGIYLNRYDDDGAVGADASWSTAQTVWSTGTTPLFADGLGEYNAELNWTIAERVAAVVDARTADGGDLHIAFTAGYSGSATGEHDVYFATYNGSSWTLPEKVADDDSDGTGTEDGIAAADTYLLSPALTQHPDVDHLFLAFGGGAAEGFAVGGVTNVNHHPYLKVLGRALTSEDESRPVGAYEYTLTYTPTNPQTPVALRADRPVWVHAADPEDGSGLGSQGTTADGFLTGNWERVGTSLQDTHKRFEGRVDDAALSGREWGDDDDKVGLLVKLNVLGSDSATNLQVVANSSAAARSVAVGTAPPVGLAAGAYFALGADVDIVATNSGPTVAVLQPDGAGDTANTAYAIRYDLADADDDLSGSLNAAFYAYPTNALRTVQEVRIFATLVADENDVSARNSAGTDDLTEGGNQSYTWDDPPAALQTGALFASIHKVRSGPYYIYLVADDGQNPPVFAVSPGPLTLDHSPIVVSVDPIVADTVDTGERTGLKANPYDLDFRVVDYDDEARIQLFRAAVTGLTSVSVTGSYPSQSFALGKSLSGTRGTAITPTTSLSAGDREYSWDVTAPLVPQGAYYLYAVASDGASATVGQSAERLVVRHAPSFAFYEPARNTQRRIDSGSQPVYTIQWQKGRGDGDLDDDASLSLYFTAVDPAATNYSGSDSTDLTDPGDGDARLIVGGLREDDDGPDDLYAWDLRTAAEVPVSGQRVWLYAVLADPSGNVSVVLGGSLLVTHSPHIFMSRGAPEINQGDIVLLEWDDYLVDDGSGTDDAYIRLYASRVAEHTTLEALEANALGGGGSDDTYIINSSDGTASGTIAPIREDSSDVFAWDTHTPTFSLPVGSYRVYAGIGADPTFADNTAGAVSEGPNRLVVKASTGTEPHMLLSPNRLRASAGDTLTLDVYVHSGGETATAVTAALNLGSGLTVVNSLSPFTDLGQVFAGGTVLEDTTVSGQLRFAKTGVAQVIGAADSPVPLARFAVVVGSGSAGAIEIEVDDQEAAISLSGRSTPLRRSTGLSAMSARIQRVARGRILGTVLLEGRAPPLGNGNHATLLDVHLRLPGSTMDIDDALFLGANDDHPATADTVEVFTTAAGGLTLVSVPAGRYVLAVRDTSHISGRTDTLQIRDGETITLTSDLGFFASDVRGDPSFLLRQGGRLLRGGDASGDNEIDEDDVNAIDAAWGTDPLQPRFAEADVNNDRRVGVEDLAVAISNISNSAGLGAPPVYRRPGPSAGEPPPRLVLAPRGAAEWRAGEEVELVLSVPQARDLAAYEVVLTLDPQEAQTVGAEADLQVGAVFAPNPQGAFTRAARRPGVVEVAAARRGQEWSASGPAQLLRLRVRLNRDGFPASLAGTRARLLDTGYAAVELGLEPGAIPVPARLALDANYPNPFNPSTTIPFSIPARFGPRPVAVRVEVYNALGQRVRTLAAGQLLPGSYRLTWDGRDEAGRAVGSGVYLCRLTAGELALSRKMLLVE